MKILKLVIFLIAVNTAAYAQSKSYSALRSEFGDDDNVCTFNVSGFFARTIIGLAGEHEFSKAIRDVKHVSLITIPATQFKMKGLTLNGFKKFMQKDRFEEMVSMKDNGDHVSIYMQDNDRKQNHYMVLIESNHEVVVIEIKGYIDPDRLYSESDLALQKI